MRSSPELKRLQKYLLVAIAFFAVLYNILQLITFKEELVQLKVENKQVSDSIPQNLRDRKVEFTFPEEGFPADSLKYDFNGMMTLGYLLESFEQDGHKDHGQEMLPWTRHCKMSRYCKPSKSVQTLYESEIGCREIMPLLEKVRKCVRKNGEKCKMILNQGFWRDVYAVDYKGQPVVLKSLKAKHVEPRNYLRQIRETIALDLVDAGKEWVVKEMGHCEVDENDGAFGYTSMVPRLRIDLEEYLKSPLYKDLTLDHALSINIMCAAGLEAIHNLPGGPFVHNDLQPRQYLVTEDGRVLLNDLNRGKFMGVHEKTGKSCGFCGSKAKGRWRAPEELSRTLLTHKLDIFSLGDVIWSTYNWGNDPFASTERKEAMRKIKRGETPEFTKMTPPEIRELVQDCWKLKPDDRPETKEIVKRLNDIRQFYLKETDFHDRKLISLDFEKTHNF